MENKILRYSISKRNKSHGSNVWYGSQYNPITKKIKWKSLYTKKKSEAIAWRDKMIAKRFLPPESKINSVSIEKAIDTFLLDTENVRKRTLGTIRIYRSYLMQFKAFCEQNFITDMRDLTPAICSEFTRHAFADISGVTAKCKLILFRSFYSWTAQCYELSEKNPFKKIINIKPKSPPREFWTIDECEKIIAAAPNIEYECLFAFMAFAGLRREEARSLQMKNLQNNKISLIGKGGKAAVLPISGRLKKYLNKYLAVRKTNSEDLFPRLSKLSKVREDIIKKAVEKSGIKSGGIAHYHRFRHSFASNLLNAGRNIKAVQILMRHESVSLTLNIYGHLLPNDLEQAVEI